VILKKKKKKGKSWKKKAKKKEKECTVDYYHTALCVEKQ